MQTVTDKQISDNKENPTQSKQKHLVLVGVSCFLAVQTSNAEPIYMNIFKGEPFSKRLPLNLACRAEENRFAGSFRPSFSVCAVSFRIRLQQTVHNFRVVNILKGKRFALRTYCDVTVVENLPEQRLLNENIDNIGELCVKYFPRRVTDDTGIGNSNRISEIPECHDDTPTKPRKDQKNKWDHPEYDQQFGDVSPDLIGDILHHIDLLH